MIEFVLDEHWGVPHVTTFAQDLPSGPLRTRIAQALILHPCDLLFVHRDADREQVSLREDEIREAVRSSGASTAICLIPVRMQDQGLSNARTQWPAWQVLSERRYVRNAAVLIEHKFNHRNKRLIR